MDCWHRKNHSPDRQQLPLELQPGVIELDCPLTRTTQPHRGRQYADAASQQKQYYVLGYVLPVPYNEDTS